MRSPGRSWIPVYSDLAERVEQRLLALGFDEAFPERNCGCLEPGDVRFNDGHTLFPQACEDRLLLVDHVLPLPDRRLRSGLEECGLYIGRKAGEAALAHRDLREKVEPAHEREVIRDFIELLGVVIRSGSFRPVDHAALKRAVEFRIRQGRGVGAKRPEGRDMHRLLHRPDLHVRQILDGRDRLAGHHVPDSGRIGSDELEAGLVCRLIGQRLCRTFQLAAQNRDVLEHERHVENTEVVHEIAGNRVRNHGHFEGSEEDPLHQLGFVAEKTIGEYLERRLAAGLLFEELAKLLQPHILNRIRCVGMPDPDRDFLRRCRGGQRHGQNRRKRQTKERFHVLGFLPLNGWFAR